MAVKVIGSVYSKTLGERCGWEDEMPGTGWSTGTPPVKDLGGHTWAHALFKEGQAGVCATNGGSASGGLCPEVDERREERDQQEWRRANTSTGKSQDLEVDSATSASRRYKKYRIALGNRKSAPSTSTMLLSPLPSPAGLIPAPTRGAGQLPPWGRKQYRQ